MGVSIHANIVVGVEIRHTDFWSTFSAKTSQPECPNGHPGPEGKFCQECGGKIKFQTVKGRTASENFVKFCKKHKLDPEEVVDPDPKQSLQEAVNSIPLGALDVAPGDLHWGSETPTNRWVLCRELAETDDILEGGRGRIIPESELKEAFDDVRAIANALGIDRPVQLYFTTSYS